MTFVLNDSRAPGREAGHHAYDILVGQRVMGFVVSRNKMTGREWLAYRVGPRRSEPWIVAVDADTRKAAAERLVGGRP